jgi:uncharacterized protein YndB with AHSA1/START domain
MQPRSDPPHQTEHDGSRMIRAAAAAVGLGAVTGGMLALAAKGALTLDVGVGRTVRPLGPLVVDIDAPRDLVFEVLSAPYLRKLPRALRRKIDVLEQGSDMVLAAHFTPVAGTVATTFETVRFEPPERINFRLVRGPVPHVAEEFRLEELGERTRFRYSGELGTDFWALGRLWGNVVAKQWEAVVEESVASVRTECERRAGRA